MSARRAPALATRAITRFCSRQCGAVARQYVSLAYTRDEDANSWGDLSTGRSMTSEKPADRAAFSRARAVRKAIYIQVFICPIIGRPRSFGPNVSSAWNARSPTFRPRHLPASWSRSPVTEN